MASHHEVRVSELSSFLDSQRPQSLVLVLFVSRVHPSSLAERAKMEQLASKHQMLVDSTVVVSLDASPKDLVDALRLFDIETVPAYILAWSGRPVRIKRPNTDESRVVYAHLALDAMRDLAIHARAFCTAHSAASAVDPVLVLDF
eukprot:ANDGO_08343.mRNA.1 hypothetical protein